MMDNRLTATLAAAGTKGGFLREGAASWTAYATMATAAWVAHSGTTALDVSASSAVVGRVAYAGRAALTASATLAASAQVRPTGGPAPGRGRDRVIGARLGDSRTGRDNSRRSA